MNQPPFLRALAKKNRHEIEYSRSSAGDLPEWPPAAPSGTAPSQAPTVPLHRIEPNPPQGSAQSSQPEVRLQVTNLSVAVAGHPPINHVTFSAMAGRVRAVVGPISGGLDPLAAALTGVVRCSSGSLSAETRPRRKPSGEWSLADWWADACSDNSTLRLIDQLGRSLGGASQRRIGHVPQRDECAWTYPASVNDIVLAAQWARHQWWRKPRPEDFVAAADALDRVGLLPIAGRDIRTLNPTEQLLLLLARGIVSAPSAVILHQPSAGLDAAGRESVAGVLRSLVAEGEALVMLTDDAPFALTCADDFTLLNCSVIAEGGASSLSDSRVWERTFRVGPESDLVRSVCGMVPSPCTESTQGVDLPASSATSEGKLTEDVQPARAPSLPATTAPEAYPWLRDTAEPARSAVRTQEAQVNTPDPAAEQPSVPPRTVTTGKKDASGERP